MADSKKVELILGIRTTGAVDAAAGLDSISKVAAELGGSLSKLERADVLKQLGATAAQVGVDIGSVEQAAERLAAELKTIGASEAEIRKVSAAFDKTTVEINKAAAAQAKLVTQQEKAVQAAAKQAQKDEAAVFAQAKLNEQMRLSQMGATGLQKEISKLSREKEFQKLATDAGLAAKKTGDVSKSVDDLTKKLTALGATKGEIAGVAGAFNEAQGESGGPIGTRITRLGAQGRNLPSMQIPGLGIGTDAVANLTRLGGAIVDFTGTTKIATATSSLLAPAIGAVAAAEVAALAPLALVIAALAIGALALKAIGDQAAIEAKAINTLVESQRDLSQRIVEGLGSEEAAAEIEILNKKRKDEEDNLVRLQQVYDENINSNKSVAHVLKLTSGAEEELITQMAKSKELIGGYRSDTEALTREQEKGAFAANDAADAEKKLADARSKTALTDADAAAKSLQAEQKSLASTEEQNKARLTAIENEKEVAQAQIDSLIASGVTSEEVTEKIKSLNAQLGLLGEESSFIKDTALAVSKQNDAAKKATKDQEEADKKAQQAQENYTKAIAAAGTAYKQSGQDIGTRLTQALSDNTLKFNRDLTNIATKYKRDEYDLTIKAQRAERDALLDQQNDLKDIRADANKDEAQALESGDFKLLFLSRKKRDETIVAEQETLDLARQKREQSARDAQDDLLLNAQRQRQDRMLGFSQQNYDTRTNQQRELAQARLTQQRALQAASEAQSAGLGQIQNYWNKFLSIQQQGMNNSLKMAAGQGAGPNASRAQGPGSFAAGSSFVANVVGGLIRR